MPAGSGDQRALIARLRAVIEAKDTENALMRAQLERYRRLELRVAELERRLGSDSSNSGIPPSKDPIGARARRKAERNKERQSSERQRREISTDSARGLETTGNNRNDSGKRHTRRNRLARPRHGLSPRYTVGIFPGQRYRTPSPVTARPMIIRWISLVPSKMVKIVDYRAVSAVQRHA
jgi:Family of unknown function (DUF6444)